MKIPLIKIEENTEAELNQFIRGLHHPQLPWIKNQILKTHPNLKKQVENQTLSQEREMEIIRNYLIGFRKKHQERIKEIIEKSQKLVRQKANEALILLSELMDYEWPENHPDYIVIPVITPHSPFEKNIIYFSILGQIYEDKNSYDVIFMATHEISHIILFDILNKQKIAGKQLSWLMVYFLKEIMAATLMNQKKLADLLDIKDYLGNPDLHYIFVEDGKTYNQICKYFQQIYENLRYKEKKSFTDILNKMIALVVQIESEIEKRFKIWNQFGYYVLKDEKILKEYSEPIRIQTSGNLF